MIRLENVSKYYHGDGTVALGLRKINLELGNKGFVVLTGESGSGKSTLLNVICGIDTYEEGEMYINNEETSYFDDTDWENYRRKSVGFIFQNYNLIDSYTVLENVEAAMVIQNIGKKERKRKALKLIEKVGLLSHVKHKAIKLSGGEKQRLAIARALAKDSIIIAADEPTGNLDSKSGKQIIELLYEISKEKLVIVVSHNYEETNNYANRRIRLFDGEIVEDIKIKEVEEKQERLSIKRTYKMSRVKKSFIFATKNLKSQPKKTTLMMMVSLAVTLIVFLVFMSFFSADSLFGGFLRGVSTNNYFANNYEERIVVIRKDGDFLNDDDIEKLGDLHYVSSLTKYSVVLDYPIYYNFLDDENTQMGPYYLKSLDTINQKSLKYGTMPIEDDEVIITDYFTSDEISQTLGKMVNTAGATINSYRTNVDLMDVSIVGTIEPDPDDACKYIYASEEFFEEYYKAYSINNNANQLEYIDSTGENITRKVDLAVDSDLTGRQMRISSMTYDGRDYKLNGEAIEVIKTSSYESTIYISQEIASDLSTINTKQVTLNLKSHDYSTEVFRQIRALKDYYVFSPYDNSTNFSLLEALILVIYSLFAFLPVLVVVYVISYLVIRTIMLSKKKDYTVLRTIGIDASTIKTMSKMEIIFCFVFAYIIIMVITIILNYRAEGEFVRTFIGALKPLYYLIIFIVNMGFGWLIARRYNKLLIKKSLLVNLKLE